MRIEDGTGDLGTRRLGDSAACHAVAAKPRKADRLFRLQRFSEQYLALVVLEQERIRNAEAGEEPQDIAIHQRRLAAPCGWIRPVPQRHVVNDDELGVAGFLW